MTSDADNTAIVRRDSGATTPTPNIEEYAMGLDALVHQVELIQQAMGAVMHEGEHYGTIPGAGGKPTLLKPGAEKLCMMFRLSPDFTIIDQVKDDSLIAYAIKCILTHIPSGQVVATGIGSCSSREAKYRWRNIASEEEVPQEYWRARKAGNHQLMRELIGEDGTPTKRAGKWYIARRQENLDPWDLDNTILKMAEKRALIAAVLVATAASDIFTQDLEDLQVSRGATSPPPPPPKPAPEPRIGKEMLAEIIEAAKEAGWHSDILKDYVRGNYGAPLTQLKESQARELLEGLRRMVEAEHQSEGDVLDL